MKESRRGIILGAATYAGIKALDGIIGNRADAILTGLPELFGKAYRTYITADNSTDPSLADRLGDDQRVNLKTLLGDRGNVLKIAGGRAHYRYANMMHPDDRWACNSILDYAAQLAQERLYDPDFNDVSDTGSFVCAGSPVSNARSRAILEYQYINPDKPELGLERIPNARIKLPIEFEFSKEKIDRSAKYTRYNHTKFGKGVPNWSIRMKGGITLSPNTADRTDLLLISRLPNWIETRPQFSDFKNSFMIFSGTHGTGTASVSLLMSIKYQNLLKRILVATSAHEYWQVLLVVRGIGEAFHPITKTLRPIATILDEDFEVRPIKI